MRIVEFNDGLAINGDSTSQEVLSAVSDVFASENKAHAVVTRSEEHTSELQSH